MKVLMQEWKHTRDGWNSSISIDQEALDRTINIMGDANEACGEPFEVVIPDRHELAKKVRTDGTVFLKTEEIFELEYF